MRLVQSEGDTENKGRVEYCNSGRWGMVCSDDNWDNNDATVICRQLGYNVESKLIIILYRNFANIMIIIIILHILQMEVQQPLINIQVEILHHCF